ncbi:MAG: NADPH-dependent F420 reductase [Bryobacteraceae bacterium]
MRIGIVGCGHIGGNCARRFVLSGKHEVLLSFSRDLSKLADLARELGDRAHVGTPLEAVRFGDVVVFSVPWNVIPEALRQAGSLAGKIVIDTTNQFGSTGLPPVGQTAAEHNAARMPGARYTKSFNTLTSRFQNEAAERTHDKKIVQWICGDDSEAKSIVTALIEDAGYIAADVGGTRDCEVMEAPRRKGAVYGEEYRKPEALAVLECLRQGKPIPPVPNY